MEPSKRFWFVFISLLILDITFTECGKFELSRMKSLPRRKRSTGDAKSMVKFISSFAMGSLALTLGPAGPFVTLTGEFMVGTLLNVVWPISNYDSIRANVLQDIKKMMKEEKVQEMKMKLNDYRGQIKRSLVSGTGLDETYLNEWIESVMANGVDLTKQAKVLQTYQNHTNSNSIRYFKNQIKAIRTDLSNDRASFFSLSSPATCLAYYREFATLELVLLASERYMETGENPNNTRILDYLDLEIRSAADRHFRLVSWAAHKEAARIEYETRDWRRYKETVESVYKEFPLQEWKNISGRDYTSHIIKNADVVSLNTLKAEGSWLHCSSSGSMCKLGPCSGIDNPFDLTHDSYKCRQEVFWIFGHNRRNSAIRNCDTVALRFSWWGVLNAGYWLSLDEMWSLFGPEYFYNTRTCPGKTFWNSNIIGKCSQEHFQLKIEGKQCGDILEDRDLFTLRNEDGSYLGAPHLCYGYLDVHCTHDLTKVYRARNIIKWRVYKHKSLIKSHLDISKELPIREN